MIGDLTARLIRCRCAGQMPVLARSGLAGISLWLPGGSTKSVFEVAVEAEMDEDLGMRSTVRRCRHGGNARPGMWTRTVLTEIGPARVDVAS